MAEVALVKLHSDECHWTLLMITLIARFMGPTWGPSGAERTQAGPMLGPWTLLSGKLTLLQVMAWCHQATSHYLSQCWPRFMLPYGVKSWANHLTHDQNTRHHSIYHLVFHDKASRENCCWWHRPCIIHRAVKQNTNTYPLPVPP